MPCDDGRRLVLREGDRVWVVANQCPHQSLSMEGGTLSDGVFRCPHHGVCFTASDGSIIDDRGYVALEPLTLIPNKVASGTVYVEEA